MSEFEVFDTPAQLASAVASRLFALIQQDGSKKLIALTGGTLGIEVIREFAKFDDGKLPVRFIFGDERFVGLSHPDRNEYQGLAAWPGLEKYLLRFPNSDQDLDAATGNFEALLKQELGDSPVFDLTILGMGPDGHIASLFPGHNSRGELVIAEKDSPKPPSKRISLSFQALNRSKQVWFVASGEAKAEAVRCAKKSDCDLPVAKVKGLEKTLWFIDKELSRAL